jgi:hypothetical protein
MMQAKAFATSKRHAETRRNKKEYESLLSITRYGS